MPSNIIQIPFSDIEFHPEIKNCRDSVGDVSDLIASIKTSGLLQPIVILEKPDKDKKRYFLVAGFRRHEAIKKIREEVKDAFRLVDVRKFEGTFADAQALNIIENIQREDLSPVEIGNGVERLMNLGFQRVEIATKIGKSTTWVATVLTFRKSAIPMVRDAVQKGKISYDLAKNIASLPEAQQTEQIAVLLKKPNDKKAKVAVRTLVRETSERIIRPSTAEVRNEVHRLEQEKTLDEYNQGILTALKWILGEKKTLRKGTG